MLKDLEIWQFAAERLKRDESLMLLVVARSAGSSPGRRGFKMVVAEDELAGSVGGGVMEVNLVETAREFLIGEKNGRCENQPGGFVETQVHRKSSPRSSGMICSGEQTIIFFKLRPAHLLIVRKLIQCLKNDRERYFQLSRNDFRIARTKKRLADFSFEISEADDSEKADFLYREKSGGKNRLFIVGGGHCSLALSELMAKLDFRVAIFDDRDGLNTMEKNVFAREKRIVESYEKIGEFVPSGANHYVVVMTLGYRSDETVIRELIERDFKYFGVLGSRAKIKILLRKLEKDGFSKERLGRIRAPVGLPINSRTPEEIAVSIAAEIVAVKNAED